MACGDCSHEVILNGACYACGDTAIAATVKPVQPTLVPISRLRRRNDSD